MSIQVGRSLGVARTVVRIDFLVKRVLRFIHSQRILFPALCIGNIPGLEQKTKRVSTLSLDKPDLSCLKRIT
jgi:hypothetical protein